MENDRFFSALSSDERSLSFYSEQVSLQPLVTRAHTNRHPHTPNHTHTHTHTQPHTHTPNHTHANIEAAALIDRLVLVSHSLRIGPITTPLGHVLRLLPRRRENDEGGAVVPSGGLRRL